MTNEEKLAMIESTLASGRPVHVATMTRVTKVTPKTAASWAAAGRPFFKLGASGSLLMIERNRYVDASYCHIEA